MAATDNRMDGKHEMMHALAWHGVTWYDNWVVAGSCFLCDQIGGCTRDPEVGGEKGKKKRRDEK